MEELARAIELRSDVTQLAVRGHDRFEAGELTAEPAELVRVREDLGRAQLAADVVVLPGKPGELHIEAGRVRHGTSGPAAISRRSAGR